MKEGAPEKKNDGTIDLIGPWKEKYGTKTNVPPASEHNEIPVGSLNDLDAAREAIANGEARLMDGPAEKEETAWPTDSLNDLDTARAAMANGEAPIISGQEAQPSEDEQFRELFNTWGEEYQEKEKGLSPEAAAQMHDDAAHLEAAGIEKGKAQGLTFAVDAYMGSPSGFMQQWHAHMSTEAAPSATEKEEGVLLLTEDMLVKEDPLAAWKKEAGEKLTALHTKEAAPLSPEQVEHIEVLRAKTESFEKAVDARVPEKHKPFIERIQQKLDSLEKLYSKCPWWGKALISGGLIGAGIAGVATGGALGATVAGIGWAGARAVSYLGAYSLMRGFTKEQNLNRQGLKNVHRGTAIAYALAMPYIVEALNSQFGISEKVAKIYADWFGGGTPTPPAESVPPTDSAGFGGPDTVINPLLMGDEPVPPSESTPEPAAPRTGSGAFTEPSPEMARYFEGTIAVKSGDTVWGLIQERLGPNGSPADVLKRVEYLKSLPAEELKKLGIGPWQESFKGFMIKPGDTINLSPLDTLGPPKGGLVWNPAAATAPTPEPIPAGISYETVAMNKFKDIQSLFGPTGTAGENAFHTQGRNVLVEKYLQADLTGKSPTGPIPGLSVAQVSNVREYVQEMATRFKIPQTGTLEQFMNKVAIAKSR